MSGRVTVGRERRGKGFWAGDEIPVPGLPCANQVPSEGLGSVISEVASPALAVSEAGLGRKEVL